jgi:hypothetical protein
MTEYDYSPEGYERYMATQTRVSKWVHEQTTNHRQYQSPFVPRSTSPPPAHYDRRPQPSHRDGSSRRSGSRTSSSHYREPRQIYQDPYSASRSAYPPQVAYVPQPPPNASYKAYSYDSTAREVVIPAPRRGETYVIIPPRGRHVEIITDGSATLNGSSSSSRESSRSPTKKSQPLLKRLFSGMSSPTRDSGRGDSRNSSSRRDRTRSY